MLLELFFELLKVLVFFSKKRKKKELHALFRIARIRTGIDNDLVFKILHSSKFFDFAWWVSKLDAAPPLLGVITDYV